MKIRNRLRRSAAITVAAVAVLVGGLASPASADVIPFNPIQYTSQNFVGQPGTVVVGTVICPSGTRMVSAGAGALPVTNLTPLPDHVGAVATGVPLGTGYITITVGCVPVTDLSEVSSRTVNFGTGAGLRRGVVTCPSGTRAFGGGGYFLTQAGSYSRTSGAMVSNTVSADGTGWTFAARTSSTTEQLVVTTQCAPLRGSHVTQTGVPLTPSGQVYGACELGFSMLSGGVYLSKPDGTEDNGNVIWSIPIADGRWFVSGNSDGVSGAKLVALAQCIHIG
jgi:hypothetical protein